MEREKYIIIGLVAVIALLAIGLGYFFLTQSVEYQTIQISSGSTIEAPKADDARREEDPNGIRTYTCPSAGVSLISFNSAENLTLVGAGAFAIARDALLANTKNLEIYNGYDIKESSINGTHYYIVNISSSETHDNIVIGSKDLNILKHMLDTLRLGAPDQVNATLTSSGSASAPVKNVVKNNTNKNKYSDDDLMRASEDAYLMGYSDGYVDSYYDSSSYYDSGSSYDYGHGIDDYSDYSNDVGSVDSGVETTTDNSY